MKLCQIRLASLPVLVLSLGLSSALLAKPLYLTVGRSYSPNENPVVDLSFAGRAPVELRVLRPRDRQAFIAAQSNLRRAYDEPKTSVNPGRYLSRGLNLLRSPAEYLLLALDPDLRKAGAQALPPRQPVDAKSLLRLREGPPKLVGVPKGFDLVRRRWLNLDLGGPERDFSVPGFTQHFGASGFEQRRVVLEPLPAGVYLLQLVQGRVEGQVLLVVTDLTLQVKQSDAQVLVRVAGRDRRPRAGVRVRARDASGAQIEALSDEDGQAWLRTEAGRLLVTASQGSDMAVVDTDFYSSLAAARDVFVYTDRPLYKPGDTVRFRGLLRQPDGFLARLFRPRRRSVRVQLFAEDRVAHSVRVRIDDFGSFWGQLTIPAGLDTGLLRVVATVDDREHLAEARVQEYVKPTFYLELDSDSETLRPGDTLRATLRARRYAGGVPVGTRFEYFLYRQILSTPAWVDDAGLGGRGSQVTYGSVSTTEGALNLPRRLFSSVTARELDFGEDPWESAASLDAKGEGTLEIKVPALAPGEERLPFTYRLVVRARDPQGSFASAGKAYFLAPSEVLGALSPSAKVVLVGGQARLSVKSLRLSGTVLPSIRGEVRYLLRQADGDERQLGVTGFTTDAQGIWRGSMPTEAIGVVIARVQLKDPQGRPWTGETQLLVAGHEGEAILQVPGMTVQTLRDVLSPGEQAELVVMLPRGWGVDDGERGSLWLSLEGTRIFESRRIEHRGQTLVYRFTADKRFGSAVYASLSYPTASGRWEERVTSFRIIPAERRLHVELQPQSLEAAPGGRQGLGIRVTDHRGRGVQAQLSVGVVDKAIYALQTELRPPVLDFFYPLVRRNVQAFYSNEFQGYGYGEVLARALATGLPFAAVKPPSKRKKNDDRDTAYWNADVRTDAQGYAHVDFELPANQTLWVVRSVAADVHGRFGEGETEFATRGALNLLASAPPFLREGDVAEGSLRISRGKKGTDKSVALDLQLGGALAPEQRHSVVDIPNSGEKIIPLSLTAQQIGRAELGIQVKGVGPRVGARRHFEVLPASVEQRLVLRRYGGGVLTLDLPEGAQVDELSVQLAPSSVATALHNIHELLVYPHGCLEQLVATTIPNLAVYRALDKIGGLDDLDDSSRDLLAEARSRSVQGIERILRLAVDGGGFTWFAGTDRPSLALTLIALDGLSQAIRAGLVERHDPRIVSSLSWLKAQAGLNIDLDATRAYVLAEIEGPAAAAELRRVLAASPEGDLYALARTVLAARRAGIVDEPRVQAQIARLAGEARKGVAHLADWQPSDPQAFWRYPLRRIGLAALLAHAASLGDIPADTLRQGLMKLVAEEGELSTFDRAMFVLHSLWFFERDLKKMRRSAPPTVRAGGKAITLLANTGGQQASLDTSLRSLEVGSFDGVATLRAHVRVPLDKLAASTQGMQVQRRYYLLGPDGMTPIDDKTRIVQGQHLFVELRVDADDDSAQDWWRRRSAYYLVEDAVPAGFVPLIEDRRFAAAPYQLPLRPESLARRSLSPEHVRFFIEEPAPWSHKARRLGYVMRAQFAGAFSAPPASVRDMYAPRIQGRSAPARLKVFASRAN